MNHLLKIHRIRLTTTLIVEALGGIALVICWSLFPDFPYYFYIAFAFALFILFFDFIYDVNVPPEAYSIISAILFSSVAQ